MPYNGAMKNQIIFIRGGESFDTKEQFYAYLKAREYNPFEHKKSWRDWVEWALSEEYEMMAPVMPNKQWADYEAWKIWFEKLFPFLNDQKLIMIGQSLGGLFLLKYLSENKFPKRIAQLHLVSPVMDNEGVYNVGSVSETVGNFILNPEKLPNVSEQADEIYIYHSTDDPLVPLSHSQRYKQHLPKAELVVLEGRGHLNQPAFIELLENINKINQK